MDSVGQQRMAALHGGRRDRLEVSPNLWAGVGLVRGGAGTALVGDPQTVAARLQEYADLGVDTFVLSGYPHLEESIRFAELVFPLLPGKKPVTLIDQVLTGGAFDVRANCGQGHYSRQRGDSMNIVDLRCRPAYLHDFFGANPGSPGYETARWLNRRVGTRGQRRAFRALAHARGLSWPRFAMRA